jgi:hypothetical protein
MSILDRTARLYGQFKFLRDPIVQFRTQLGSVNNGNIVIGASYPSSGTLTYAGINGLNPIVSGPVGTCLRLPIDYERAMAQRWLYSNSSLAFTLYVGSDYPGNVGAVWLDYEIEFTSPSSSLDVCPAVCPQVCPECPACPECPTPTCPACPTIPACPDCSCPQCPDCNCNAGTGPFGQSPILWTSVAMSNGFNADSNNGFQSVLSSDSVGTNIGTLTPYPAYGANPQTDCGTCTTTNPLWNISPQWRIPSAMELQSTLSGSGCNGGQKTVVWQVVYHDGYLQPGSYSGSLILNMTPSCMGPCYPSAGGNSLCSPTTSYLFFNSPPITNVLAGLNNFSYWYNNNALGFSFSLAAEVQYGGDTLFEFSVNQNMYGGADCTRASSYYTVVFNLSTNSGPGSLNASNARLLEVIDEDPQVKAICSS